jgi:hypothetical protein
VVNPRRGKSNKGRVSRNQEKSRKALPAKKKKKGRKRRKKLDERKVHIAGLWATQRLGE